MLDTRRIPIDQFLYQDTRWCEDCGGPQLMISVFEIESGRIALCLGCEKEKFLPFSRVTVGAA